MTNQIKRKIAIIGNEENDRSFLEIFKLWREHYLLDYHVFDKEPDSATYAHFSNLYVYEQKSEYPGYMNGLESRLHDVSCIFLTNGTHLGSFQAARFARKYDIPYIVLLSDHQIGLFKLYKNLNSIQFDVLTRAEEVWPLSEMARDLAHYYQVSTKKIKPMKLPLISENAEVTHARRKKFRKLLNLSESDVLCVFSAPLESYNNPELVLSALSIANQRNEKVKNRLRLLFFGDGSQCENLKTKAFELKLGHQVMFLTQNYRVVEREVIASADLMVNMPVYHDNTLEKFPYHFLRCMAEGVFSIYNNGSIFSEYSYHIGICLNAPDDYRLALSLIETMESHVKLSGFTEQRKELFLVEHEPTAIQKETLSRLDLIINRQIPSKSLQEIYFMREAEIKDLIEKSRHEDATLLIEEGLLNYQEDPILKSLLLNLKARVLMDKGNIDDALVCYIDAVKLNPKNHIALRNLGVISWITHAHEDAITYFRKTLALSPDDAESLLGLGLIYQRIGINDEAFFWLDKALSFHATEKRALRTIIQIAKDYQDKNFSRKILEHTYENYGDYSPLLMALGETCLALGDNKKGSQYIELALSLDRSEPNAAS